MARLVTKIECAAPPVLPRRKRVAAYARVSLGTEHMLHSLAAQVSFYSDFIQKNGEWDYAGVYADADETGTREDRPEFQRLLADCRAGRIDIVLTKSISRFARNTVTLLETVRELKNLGIDIFFEEQSIHTLSGDGELMLTILASYAQEESRSVSENIKWRKRNDMKSGRTKPVKAYGYVSVNGNLIIKPEEAEVVRLIFTEYLGGLGTHKVAGKLNEMGIRNVHGCKWGPDSIRRILINPKMCGDLLHQRRFVEDHISMKQVTNKGELPMYLIQDNHEGIVSREIFDAVQAELARRDRIGSLNESDGLVFRKKIHCGNCGQRFCHATNGQGAYKHHVWVCRGRDKRTGINCTILQIPEPTLMVVSADILGLDEFDGEVFTERIEKIIARDGRQLTFVFKDGAEVNTAWQKRKSVPYSKIGIEKRQGRNICYSIIGKGKVSERRKRKEAKLNDQYSSNSREES